MRYKIIIGNKNYSSWSMRPWLVLDHFGFDYDEELIPLRQPDTRSRVLAYSPGGKVPVLVDRAFAVWDSLAIIEYLAEMKPEAGIWPMDRQDRARARALAAEMHSGFPAMRHHCPMNLRRKLKFRPRGGAAAEREVERFEQMVRDAMMRSGGPFLFGAWSAADAMYAPFVARLTGYSWPLSEASRAYCAAVEEEASFQRWREAALKEPWVMPVNEVK